MYLTVLMIQPSTLFMLVGTWLIGVACIAALFMLNRRRLRSQHDAG